MCWKYFVPNHSHQNPSQFDFLRRRFLGYTYKDVDGGCMVMKDPRVKEYGEPIPTSEGFTFYPPKMDKRDFDINKYMGNLEYPRQQVDLKDGRKVFIIPALITPRKIEFDFGDDDPKPIAKIDEQEEVYYEKPMPEDPAEKKKWFEKVKEQGTSGWDPVTEYGQAAKDYYIEFCDTEGAAGVNISKKMRLAISLGFLYSYDLPKEVLKWWQQLEYIDFVNIAQKVTGGTKGSLTVTPPESR